MNKCRQSSSLILMRQCQQGPENFKVLMIKRNDNISFGSSYAFPGGSLESLDQEVAMRDQNIINQNHAKYYSSQLTPWYPAALAGVLRETFEETGIVFPPEQFYKNARPILRIITPQMMKKRYDTQFFIAKTQGIQEETLENIKIDIKESQSFEWGTPTHFINKFLAKEINLFPPIYLQLLAMCRLKSINSIYQYADNLGHFTTFPTIFQFANCNLFYYLEKNSLTIHAYGDKSYNVQGLIDNEQTEYLKQELIYRNLKTHEGNFRILQTTTPFSISGLINSNHQSILNALNGSIIENQKLNSEVAKL